MHASLGSIGVAIGGGLIKPLTAGIIGVTFAFAYQVAPVQFRADDWRVWVLGFFAVEFAYYWFHRWSYGINWLWASHAVYHSANEMTLPATIRLGWTGGWLVFVPLVLIGFSPIVVGGLLAANLLFQYSLHTEAIGKQGSVEYLFNTPSHHRAHHASGERWLDCNFGGVLIVFDRIFGTFVPEPDGGGLTYGLVKPLTSNNPFRIAFRQWGIMFRELSSARSSERRLTILFGRPASLDERQRGA